MNKIEGIKDVNSPMSVYYNQMCTQPKENRTFAFVCQQFLNLDLPKEKPSSSKGKTNVESKLNDRTFENLISNQSSDADELIETRENLNSNQLWNNDESIRTVKSPSSNHSLKTDALIRKYENNFPDKNFGK